MEEFLVYSLSDPTPSSCWQAHQGHRTGVLNIPRQTLRQVLLRNPVEEELRQHEAAALVETTQMSLNPGFRTLD